MKNIKRLPRWDPPYNTEKLEEKMERMAQNGWMLNGSNLFVWKFRKIEPAKIHFKATYYDDNWPGFDPAGGLTDTHNISNHQREYWNYGKKAGWKIAATDRPLQIFYNEQEDPEPLETDPVVQVENIHNAMRHNWMLILLFILTIAWFVFETVTMFSGVDQDHSITTIYEYISVLLGLIVLVVLLLKNVFWYQKAKKRVTSTGEVLKPHAHYYRFTLILIVIVIGFLFTLFMKPIQSIHSSKKADMPITLQQIINSGYDNYRYNVQMKTTSGLREISFSQNAADTDLANLNIPAMSCNVYLVTKESSSFLENPVDEYLERFRI